MPMGIREWGFTFFKGSQCCYMEYIGSVSFAILAETERKCLVPLTLPPSSCHTVTADLDGTPRCEDSRREHREFHPVFGIVPAKVTSECPNFYQSSTVLGAAPQVLVKFVSALA